MIPAGTPTATPSLQGGRPRGEIPGFSAETLGCDEFRNDHGARYAYVAGGMYRGISSGELVARMAKAGFLNFFGTGGLGSGDTASAISRIKRRLSPGDPFGMNLVSNLHAPEKEEKAVDL